MGKVSAEELAELQNPETWEDEAEPERPPVKSPRAIVSVAFSREDFEHVAEYAQQHGMKTSEFIRRAALDATLPSQHCAMVTVSGGVMTGGTVVTAPRARVEVTMPEPPVNATN